MKLPTVNDDALGPKEGNWENIDMEVEVQEVDIQEGEVQEEEVQEGEVQKDEVGERDRRRR